MQAWADYLYRVHLANKKKKILEMLNNIDKNLSP